MTPVLVTNLRRNGLVQTQRWIMKQLRANRRLGLKQTDERLKLVNEVMSGIRAHRSPPPCHGSVLPVSLCLFQRLVVGGTSYASVRS